MTGISMLGKKALTLIAQHILPCFPCQVVWRKHVVITLTEIPYWLQDLPTPEKAKPALGYITSRTAREVKYSGTFFFQKISVRMAISIT